MNYELRSVKIGGMVLNDAAQEFSLYVDITVGIVGANAAFEINNPRTELIIRDFTSYANMSTQITNKAAQWVIDNYPNTV